ncbi:predicted protein [Naegleria gruberi]|uniref:Predicted protein n=1 Tax=Naegleria gruberi TaxID=5762 RepID=D2VY38_NAEGR|nr:uncharacterized protein NAEGRDRAFT_73959 [Naegleria gruberi]EFC38257.1 predicted protein [Naegleria gruberi]|eukprot:XP_002671001.1 predicted protein [Naegleria gruberi strain NEG-M]
MVDDMWQFMSYEFKGTGEEFELFMGMLLLHESTSLKGQSFTKSPLFKSITNSTLNLELEEWSINIKSLLHDRNLSKITLQITVGNRFTQLANNYFRNSFIKPYDEACPDGMFYLKHHQEEKYQLVICAMTLIADPVTDRLQPDKALNLLKTLVLYSGKDESEIHTENSAIGWIIAPNMDANTISLTNLRNLKQTPTSQALSSLENGSLKLMVTEL